MAEYIKLGSDRPDYTATLRDQNDRVVDLRDAAAVRINVWVGDNVLMLDAAASVDAARLGAVSYDFDREEIDTPGSALVEFRVEWSNGDHQWFPTDERGFELEIVPPPGDRDVSPAIGWGVLTIGDGETHTVSGTETYSRVENGGTLRTWPGGTLRTGGN